MTWIVKATSDYAYNCHPDGEVYGKVLSDAWRYKVRAEAEGVARRLNRDMKDGLPYRVVRLTRPRDRLRAAAQAVVDNARDQGRDDCMDDLVDEQYIEELRNALRPTAAKSK